LNRDSAVVCSTAKHEHLECLAVLTRAANQVVMNF